MDQSLFLRGYKMAFSQDFRAQLDSRQPLKSDALHPQEGQGSDEHPESSKDSRHSPSDSEGRDERGSSERLVSGSLNGIGAALNGVYLGSFPSPSHKSLHPSDAMADHLLQKTGASVALIHDDNWRFAMEGVSLFEGHADYIPLPQEVLMEGGVVYLQAASLPSNVAEPVPQSRSTEEEELNTSVSLSPTPSVAPTQITDNDDAEADELEALLFQLRKGPTTRRELLSSAALPLAKENLLSAASHGGTSDYGAMENWMSTSQQMAGDPYYPTSSEIFIDTDSEDSIDNDSETDDEGDFRNSGDDILMAIAALEKARAAHAVGQDPLSISPRHQTAGNSRSQSSPTGGNYSFTQLENPRTRDAVQSIVKGRKSWKTLRGGEIVWPPELEAALIEGLENYLPDDSRETRLLGRFPLRNRFISDWIFEKTGKRRTAKQVGGRLQQLRDTFGGRKVLDLLSPKRPAARQALSLSTPEIPNSSDGNPTSRPLDTHSPDDSFSKTFPTTTEDIHLREILYRGVAPSAEPMPNSVVYIDLLPTPPSSRIVNWPTSSSWEEEHMWIGRGIEVVRLSHQPRYISDIKPTVTFTSPSPISAAHSDFSLYLDDDLIHCEDGPLVFDGLVTPDTGPYLYSTRLLPGYWPKLCQTVDVCRYTIVHRVVGDNSSEKMASDQINLPSATMPTKVYVSTMYRFRYPPFASLHPTTIVRQREG
ncbi:hypothetical protein DFP72DRAFT_1002917 [Ephemerocybe angulata]|uniref:TEA domain-containing protein n=1 Tax=Ephemerocybe angulata TaxID=980116 RepID=A0A8H6I902_9AGAR|nr:hypothetical protein DFP72DRAFT_1002917 [Tulosesus angulatus]